MRCKKKRKTRLKAMEEGMHSLSTEKHTSTSRGWFKVFSQISEIKSTK